jgi:cell division control protein 24
MLVTDMTSSLHTRAYPSASFPSPGIGSRPNHYGAASMRADQIGEQQGLFPPPIPAQMASTTPSETSRPNDNIMNRRGDSNSSLYQICLNLRKRMAEVPGFEVHMLEMEEEEAEANDSTDPVTSMWNCLRRGYPLMTIYNALKPRVPLEVDASRLAEAKLGKAATFKFLQACLTDLKFRASECFLITDLYGGDTTGFVKVSKTCCVEDT